jgi:hypothetical protein
VLRCCAKRAAAHAWIRQQKRFFVLVATSSLLELARSAHEIIQITLVKVNLNASGGYRAAARFIIGIRHARACMDSHHATVNPPPVRRVRWLRLGPDNDSSASSFRTALLPAWAIMRPGSNMPAAADDGRLSKLPDACCLILLPLVADLMRLLPGFLMAANGAPVQLTFGLPAVPSGELALPAVATTKAGGSCGGMPPNGEVDAAPLLIVGLPATCSTDGDARVPSTALRSVPRPRPCGVTRLARDM